MGAGGEKVERLSALLHEAAETHHRVFRIQDGADDDWASWYSSWLTELSELPELVHLADRCLVVYGGRIFAELAGADINERILVAALTGHSIREAAA